VIVYDKNGADEGVAGFRRQVGILQERAYDLAVVPHRSLRSAALARMAKIPRRIGFDRSSGRWLFTDIVRYDPNAHEIERNIRLLTPLAISVTGKVLPSLFPSDADRAAVAGVLGPSALVGASAGARNFVAMAPGSVWNTKRWPAERFGEVARRLGESGIPVVVVGGEADRALGESIAAGAGTANVVSAAGKLTLLQSAALIGMSRLLVTNDTAPMHIAVAMRTPVLAIFGATVPSFGFAPYGAHDVILETNGLKCRPCSVHGGDTCPIGTFECMLNISAEAVVGKVMQLLA
jgi:heptosyltransferase-2